MVADLEERLEQFRQRCRDAGLALTHQRETIFRTVLETSGHPSPEQIYQRVKKRIPAISLATVYKNIHAFLAAGLLREVSVHHGALLLEASLDGHHHLVCVQCKSIVDLPPEAVGPVELRRKLPAGYQVVRHQVEILALCPGCARKKTLNSLQDKHKKESR
jgi:Fur family peroxide stress response transcriptional regulator